MGGIKIENNYEGFFYHDAISNHSILNNIYNQLKSKDFYELLKVINSSYKNIENEKNMIV